jgi:hypothetical protein
VFIVVNSTIDPSAEFILSVAERAQSLSLSLSNGTTVRAGPNGADRVLGDKERRLTEIFFKYARFFQL